MSSSSSTPRHRAPRGRAARATLADETRSSLVAAAPGLSVRQVFARFWPLTKPFRLRLAVCLLFVAVGPAMDAAGIWIFKILVDDVLTPRDFSLFPLVAAAYIGIALAGGLLSFIDDYLCTWVGERFVLTLRTDLFTHLHRMSLGFFERRQLGDLMSRISSDVNAIEQLVLSGVMQVIAHGIKILIFGGMLFALLLDPHEGGVAGEAPPYRHHLGRRGGEPEQRRPRPGLRPARPRRLAASTPRTSVPSPLRWWPRGCGRRSARSSTCSRRPRCCS